MHTNYLRCWLALLFAGLLLWATGAADAQQAQKQAPTPTVTPVIIISLAEQPLVHVTLRLENLNDGSLINVDWDPDLALPLARKIRLSPGTWRYMIEGDSRLFKAGESANSAIDIRLDLSKRSPSPDSASDAASARPDPARSASPAPSADSTSKSANTLKLTSEILFVPPPASATDKSNATSESIVVATVPYKTNSLKTIINPGSTPTSATTNESISNTTTSSTSTEVKPTKETTETKKNTKSEDRTQSIQNIFYIEPIKISFRIVHSNNDRSSLPNLATAKTHLYSRSSTDFRDSSGEFRGINDAAPQVILDLFQVLGEIAIERAKSKGFSVLHDRVKKAVCEEIPQSIGANLKEKLQRKILGNAQGDQNNSGEPLLKFTCDVVRNFRLQDLETIRKPLLLAILRDVGDLGIEAAWVPTMEALNRKLNLKGQLDVPLNLVRALLRKSVLEQQALTQDDGHVLLLRLSEVDWPNVAAGEVGCGIEIAFAVAATCYQQGGCTAVEVAQRISHPDQYFNISASSDRSKSCNDMKNLASKWPDLDRFVAQLQLILQPPKGLKPKGQLKILVSLSLDIMERILEYQSAAAEFQDAKSLLSDMRAFSSAAIEGDVPGVIVAVGGLTQRLLSTQPKETTVMAKAMQLVSAVTAYASTYLPMTEQDTKALHESRKKAIENLIDAATQRSERPGEWIVSLGGNVGTSLAGAQYVIHRSGFEPYWANLALPLGIAVQRLPRGKTCGGQLASSISSCRAPYLGWHFQLSPIDLGQFVAYDGSLTITATKWANFLTASAQVGMLLGGTSSPFTVALDVRWSPTLFTQEQTTLDASGMLQSSERSGAVRVGLFVGYYVPFFDFN